MTDPRYNPSLHRVALLTAAATFPLIFMGGLVTSHGAGMSVPDWPNSYGYNMFTFPPSIWLGNQAGGVFYEHSHRLMATLVGMLSIVLTAWAWKTEPRRWVRWLATSVLGAVVFQGVLGGLRVIWVNLDLAIVHACFAQAFFCLAVLTAVVTSRSWLEGKPGGVAPDRALFRTAVALVLVVYLQLVVGAVMRHYRAGLAIPDMPLAYGKVLPPVSHDGLNRVNESRRWDAGLPAVTLGQVWLHFGHRVGAVAVCTAAGLVVFRVVRRRHRALFLPATVLSSLLAAQVTLGVLTVLWRKPADVASLHVAVGALVLVTSFVIAARARRLDWLTTRVSQTDMRHAGTSPAPARIQSQPGQDIRGGAELAPA